MPRFTDHGPDWTKSWGSLGEVSKPDGEQDAGDLRHLHDPGNCSLTNCYSSELSFQRRTIAGKEPEFDAIAVGLVRAGRAVVGGPENRFTCGPDEGFVVDLTKSLQFFYDSLTTTQMCILWLPRIRLRLASVHLVNGVSYSPATLAGAVLAAALGTLSARIERTEPAELGGLTVGLAAMVAAAVQAGADTSVKWGREARMNAIFKFIDANLTSPLLEPDRVAGQFGLSRASLYRLFEPLGGVAGFIRERRLQRAMEELTARGAPSRSIAAVGRRMGYPDATSFSRAFRGQFGVAPRDLIRRERQPDAESHSSGRAAMPVTKALTLAACLSDLNSRRR